jgi:pimeloyl-ACP methyl ester carboxylesterase
MRLTKVLALAFALPALMAAAGCETVMAADAERKFPVQGRLVEVGQGRHIQIDCRGQGSPTVVFQSGGDMLGSLAWTPVHDRIAQTARACAYSRAGVLWSDRASGRFEPEEVARDLHAALDAAGERGPYVLVAHSRGGLYNMIFAGLYPDDIAGLVFADSSHPDQEQRFAAAGVPKRPYVSFGEEAALAFGWTGVLRLADYPADASIAEPVRAYYPKSAAANAREARARAETLTVAGRYRDLRNWPVIVLAREMPEQSAARAAADARDAPLLSSDGGADDLVNAPKNEEVWRELQADLATWSSRGRLVVVPNSNHAFFFSKPDVVVGAVNEVVAAARVVRRPVPLPE